MSDLGGGGRQPVVHSLVHYAAVEPLAAEWEALADASGAPPWLRPGWVSAWWRSFGAGKLDILGLRCSGELVGVLPMRRHRGALSSTTNWHTPEYGILARPGDMVPFCEQILALRPRRLALAFVDADDRPQRELVRCAHAAGYHLLRRVLEHSPYVVTADGDADAWESARDTKLLRELRRRRRKLEAVGDVAVDVSRGDGDLDALLREGFRVEAAGWKGRAGTAIASDPRALAFYTDIARWARERGSLRLAFLRVSSRAIAFDLSIEEGGHHYLLKTGYDPDYGRYASGMLLRHAMIRRAFEDRLQTYELLGTDEPWKMQWTHDVRPRSLVQAFAPTGAGVLDWTAYRVGRPLVKRALAVARP